MQKKVDGFIEKLSKFESKEDLFNMYNSEAYRHNLKQYLLEMISLKPKRMFVGEAPGPNGTLRTGIPFTDEIILSQRPITIGGIRIFTKEYFLPLVDKGLISENSGKCVWNSFIEIGELPLLWNAVPYYPHKKYDFMELRNPTDCEVRMFSNFIVDLLEMFPTIEYFAAIGRKGQIALVEALEWPPYIKHPSRYSSSFKGRVDEIITNELGKAGV